MTFEEQRAIREALKYTWTQFFSPHKRLLPPQILAIPIILSGKNVIIQSPTASGKTEAVIAPLLERIITLRCKPPSILYISPTRALIYDLYERLHTQIEYLNLRIAVRTADKHQFNEQDPQDIILTTPESLDSLLCRNLPILKSIKFTVLDELHLLDSNYRGDQLRLDLARLKEISEGPIQYCALSATFSNPKATAEKYFSPIEVISVPGTRELIWEIIEWTDENSIKALLQNALSKRYKKLLFFCNSRREVEHLGQTIKRLGIWPRGSVFVHHGSLSFTERNRTEEAMRELGALICVATMSLEVGIDIGDIDLIVLVRPPPSVASLLQRVGRGNRRRNNTIAVGLFTNEDERDDLEEKFHLAVEGKLEIRTNGPCLSVAIQQAFSYVFQNRHQGTTEEEITSLLKVLPVTDYQVKLILTELEEKGYIQRLRGLIQPTSKLSEMGERGQIHSNISSSNELKIMDSTTGKLIGEISSFEPIGKKFVLSGKSWEVSSITRDKVTVKSSSKGNAALPNFSPWQQHGKFFWLLPNELKSGCCKPIE